MCRNIKTLYHFEPPAPVEEVRASALQCVRNLRGLKSFSKKNQAACEHEEQRKAVERGRKREAQLRARYGAA